MNLASKVYNLDRFQDELKKVVKRSVSHSLEGVETENDDLFASQIDWDYLLLCASLLAHSKEAEAALHQDAALRIAHSCLEDDLNNQVQKLGAAIVLRKLTNEEALKLAKNREHITDADIKETPLPLKLEQTKRTLEHTISLGAGKEKFLNKFQKQFWDAVQKADHVSASAPTSAGKSFLLNLFVTELFRGKNDRKVVYIVPTRALISQVEDTFFEILFKEEMQEVYLSSVPQLPKEINQETSALFIFTQERLHWFLNQHPEVRIDFLVVDEAQKISDRSRGILLQEKIEELIRKNPSTHFIFTSAFTENPEILLDGLPDNASKAVINVDFTAVNQNRIWVSCRPGNRKQWFLSLYRQDDIISLGTTTFPRALQEGEKLAALGYRLGSKDGGNMIYVNGQKEAEKVALKLHSFVKVKDDIIVDDELKDLANISKRFVHPEFPLARVVDKGIAFHYGNMPLLVKKEVERLFKEGKIKYLICTSTLLEGVNLPAKAIFMRKPSRGRGNPLSEDDFLNLAGRAGRLTKEFQGNVICIDPQDWPVPPPRGTKKYAISRAVTNIAKDNYHLLEYFQKEMPREELESSDQRQEYESAISYYFIKYLREGSLDNSDLSPDFKKLLEQECENASKKIDIPKEIIFRNPGISPFSQQKLLQYFREYEKGFTNLIPPKPTDASAITLNDDEGDSSEIDGGYVALIRRIARTLSGENEKLAVPRAILVVRWMSGMPLGRIINANFKYLKKNPPKNKAVEIEDVIRDTMYNIESYVRFQFARNISCYVDVLRFFFEKEHPELLKNVPDLDLWVEFGVSQKTQISLINIGFSRQSAIELGKYAPNHNMERHEIIKWLMEIDVSSFEIPQIIKDESREIKKRFRKLK